MLCYLQVDELMVTTCTSTPLDSESFLNQPVHTDTMQNLHTLPNINVQAEDNGIMAVIGSSVHKEARGLNETQLKVYQKFIPIKPKLESQGEYLI